MGELSVSSQRTKHFMSIELSEGWAFKQVDATASGTWLPVKRTPSTIHQDLIDNDQIAHPFIGFNELKAEWVAEKSWIYRTTFKTPEAPPGSKFVLAFDGLDTFATIKLDSKIIRKSDNMFLPQRVDITEFITKDTQECMLEIEFEPALQKAREIQAQHPDHRYTCFNGESARLCARKAQYHWGWDWGPRLMCCGIWRPVRLEVYKVRISLLQADVKLASDYGSATVDVRLETEGGLTESMIARFTASLDGEVISSCDTAINHDGRADVRFPIKKPQLWMPHGYGKQSLYTIKATISKGGEDHAGRSTRIGLRKVELVQEQDKHGKSFFFRINGVDVFCGGSCWIPADSFLTEVTPERYRAWLELLVPANQVMIRVWGGGIYENDIFYDICDELGILVWQDFMFACGNYPTWLEMLESIEAEAVANVRRLRHHPSIVIFAGNNEDYQVQEQCSLTYDYEDKDPKNWLKTDFPARFIYEHLLPRVMNDEAPSIPYHPGSPWGDGKISSDATVGDMHQWNVWHGTQEKYQIFDTLGGRFNSEFGMEAFPHIATIRSFVEHEEDLYAQSHVLDFHNKADVHERRLATYMVENVRTASPTDLESYAHLTQLVQCEALMFGYRGWRRQWGDSRHCGGALVWQLNDCWPVTSWSIVDYYLRRKPSYYALARVLAPLAVGVRRQHHDWSVTHARVPKTQTWELWAVSTMEDMIVDAEVRFISVRTGLEIKDKILLTGIQVQGNGSTDIIKGQIDNEIEEPHVLAARVFVNGRVLARDTDWPQPFKYLSFSKRNLKVEVEHGGREMHITAERPVKCLVFEEREGCHLSDSAIDVMPGDPQTVTVKGLKHGQPPLSWMHLGIREQ